MRKPKKEPKLIIFKVINTESGNIGKIDSKIIRRIPAIGPILVNIVVEFVTKLSIISLISSPLLL